MDLKFQTEDRADGITLPPNPEPNNDNQWWRENTIVVLLLVLLAVVVFIAFLAYTKKTCSRKKTEQRTPLENNSSQNIGPFCPQEMPFRPPEFRQYVYGQRIDEPPPSYQVAVQESSAKFNDGKSSLDSNSDILVIESPPSYFVVQDTLRNTGN